MTPHDLALNKTKIALMGKEGSAFFTTLVFSLRMAWDESIPTACTDGKWIWISPKYFMSLSPSARVTLLVHEAMHCAYLHMDRLGTKKMPKWNYATDYVINLQLHDRGFEGWPNWLLDTQYKDMSSEQVYNLLGENLPPPPMDDLRPSEASSEKLKQDMDEILVRAAIQSKARKEDAGSIPGDIQIYLNNLLNPKLPWNQILQRYLKQAAKEDYSFRKPNRRYFPKLILPSLYSQKVEDLAIAIDTSGSITDEQFHQFISETHSLLRMMKPQKLSLIQFDTSIKSVDTIKNIHDLMRVKFSGRGGTMIAPVLEWANANKPKVLLVFSDGEFYWPGIETKVNTIWLIHGEYPFTPPFGKTINYKINP